MNASRKSHRKSRGGCTNCKKRKIKCDEQKPACSNCTKHSIECDFAARETAVPTTPTQPPGVSTPIATDGSNSQSPGITCLPDHGQGSGFLMRDLELLHNYSTVTAMTMSDNNELRTVWRINVPQVAFSQEYVMRGVLALSALHLAYCKPAMREYYQSQAKMHQDIAFRTAATLLPDVNEDNCNALFIFTAIATVISLASTKTPRDFLLTREDGVTSWLSLLRGVRGIIDPYWKWLASGPLGPLFTISGEQMRKVQALGYEDFLPDLRRLVLDPNTVQPEDLKANQNAVDGLNPVFVSVYRADGARDYTEIVSFIYRLDELFLSNLADRKPHALVILAYYCVLLKKIDHYWWIGNWGMTLLARVYELLDAEHRIWIQWPIEEIGWAP